MIEPLPVIVKQVAHETDEDLLYWVIECPHCAGRDAFREVERAERWTTFEVFDVVDGQLDRIEWQASTGGDWRSAGYQCEHCNNPVIIKARRNDYMV